MFGWVTDLVRQMGYLGIGLLMLLENVFPPIPSEIIMPLAGFVAVRGELSFWLAIVAGTVGSLLGALGWYWVGRRVGEQRLRRWVRAHGRWFAMNLDDVDRAVHWFERHGGAAVLIGRLIPAVRTLISVPAGLAGMPLVPFLLYTVVGTAAWTAALAWAGRLLGQNYQRVSEWIDPVSWVVLAVIVLTYVVRVIRWEPADGERDEEEERGAPA